MYNRTEHASTEASYSTKNVDFNTNWLTLKRVKYISRIIQVY